MGRDLVGALQQEGFWVENSATGVWKCEVSRPGDITGDAEKQFGCLSLKFTVGSPSRTWKTACDPRDGFLDHRALGAGRGAKPRDWVSRRSQEGVGRKNSGNVHGAGRKTGRTGEVPAAQGRLDGEMVPVSLESCGRLVCKATWPLRARSP